MFNLQNASMRLPTTFQFQNVYVSDDVGSRMHTACIPDKSLCLQGWLLGKKFFSDLLTEQIWSGVIDGK